MTAQDTPRLCDTRAIVHILKKMQQEVDNGGDVSITRILAPFPVFLWDVCEAFGLSQGECDEVLGRSAPFVARWLNNVSARNGD